MVEFPCQHPTSHVSRISEGTTARGGRADVVDLIDALIEEATPAGPAELRRRNDASQETLLAVTHVSGCEHKERVEAGATSRPSFVVRRAGRSRFAD